MLAGYSGTPLVKKLGLKPPLRLLLVGEPDGYIGLLEEIGDGVALVHEMEDTVDACHIFTTHKQELAELLNALRTRLDQSGFIWVSWPKKASKMPTEVDEAVIREVALPMGYVDIKVCAVNEVWSGLKLVIRASERSGF